MPTVTHLNATKLNIFGIKYVEFSPLYHQVEKIAETMNGLVDWQNVNQQKIWYSTNTLGQLP